jgi:hypothetical protein
VIEYGDPAVFPLMRRWGETEESDAVIGT